MSDTALISAPQTAGDTGVPPHGPAPSDASAATSREDWLRIMDEIGEESGYLEPLGAHHWAFFVDEGPVLLVTFERLEDIRARPNQMPQGHDIATARGWSHLCLIAEGETWYRDRRVYGYFDRLVDDAFLEDFDRVLFMGAGVQGYAAAAFSVAAPGASVLAISPRATQAPAYAGWDRRSPAARRLDFTSRYGYAPDMVEGAGQVFLIFDPQLAEDAMHAALFRGPHVTHLHTPRLGARSESALAQMQLVEPLVEAAVAGQLDAAGFARLWRQRRNFGPYLRALLNEAELKGRTGLEKVICQNVNARLQAPRFRKRLADILAAEAVAEAEAADLPEDQA